MASRTTYSELSSPPVTGAALLEEYSDRLKTLFDASALPLISVGGTANAVTATLDPALDGGGLVDGMKFEITWAATNTGGVTLALNGGSAISVLDPAGTALVAGAIGSGLRSLLEYIGGAFRILSPLLTAIGGGTQRYFWQITASGTWNKPAGLDDDTMVTIEAWGGGGGGSSANNGPGGGGGGYSMRRMRIADLPASVSVTIGAGGAVNARGGNTTFGSLLTAYNGGGGISSSSGGAGGGGEISQGGNASGTTTPGAGGSIGGGNGSLANAAGEDARSIWGGGGGAGSSTGGTGGGNAVFGGGGGAGANSGGSGGISINGGNGGGSGVAGAAPGGGGGRNAAGARGEVRVWI